MKNIQFVICAVAGSLSLALSSQAAVQGIPITLTATTYHQSSSTNGAVVTYTTSSTALNDAVILTKAQTTLGVTFPAGSKLAVSIVNIPHVSEGDIVVLNAAGQIIWNLAEVETANGEVEADFFVDIINSHTVNASKSSTTTFNGLAGFFLDFNLENSAPTAIKPKDLAAGDEEEYNLFDMQCSGSYIRGNNSTELTSGTVSSAGAGEHAYFTFSTDNTVFEPVDGTLFIAASQLPWSIFSRSLEGEVP